MIFPFPKEEKYSEGSYKVKSFSDNLDLLDLFQKCKEGNEDVNLVLNEKFDKEEYEISVNEKGIKLTHNGDCSIFRAVTSLSQLIFEYGEAIPFCHIKDKPDFEKRAYMLDISRGKVPKVEAIMKYIDILAGLKYNEFQLYIENFVFKYKDFPELTKDFDCLTPEDIQFLDKYCKDRFIEFIPNQNSFGHMHHWIARDEYRHLGVGHKEEKESSTINPLLPESLELIEKIYDSLLPNFTSEYVHVGFDEAAQLGKYELEKPCKENGEENIFMDWLCKVADLVKTKHGKKVQFWSDMIDNYPEIFKRMPEGAVATVWGYDKISTNYLSDPIVNLERLGAEYYVCPGDSTWGSFTGRFDVMHFNVRLLADMGHKHGAKGYMLTSWGNCYSESFPVWKYVPCALGALYSWDIGEVSNCNIKTADVRKAEKYVDEHIFGAPISLYLRKLQRYHLLEPEPTHNETFTIKSFREPLDKSVTYSDFDLCEYGDTYEADLIIKYMNDIFAELDKIEFDADLKAQIYCNVQMVIFVQEFNKIRMKKKASAEKLDELIALADEIISIFDEQWEKDNFSHGKEIFTEVMNARKNELVDFKNKNC